MSLLELERKATVACLGPAPSERALQALGGDPRIWSLYREMIRSRLRGELKVALRRSCEALGDAAFERIFEHQLEHEPPRSRPFHGIVEDFAKHAIAFLHTDGAQPAPAFIADLIAFEAALWAVGDLDDRVTGTVQELSFEAIPCFTPALRVLALKHAVHEPKIDGGYRAGDVWLIVARRPEEQGARTFVLNATSHALVLALQTGTLTITEAVQHVATERKLKVDAAFLDGLCTVLADFVERGVLLGSKG